MPHPGQNHCPRPGATAALAVIVTTTALSTLVTPGASAAATPVATVKLAPGEFGLPVAVVSQVEAVPVATLVAQAMKRPGDAEPPQALKAGTPAFALGGKPAVVFIGAEYCPYCSSERWPLVMALSKFGTFEGLRGSMSSATDVDPSTPSFSFYRSTYTSRYLSFLADEMETGTEQPLQAPTAEEQALVTKYDTTPYVPAADAGQNPIPFVFMAGHYVMTGNQFNGSALSGMKWATAAAYLTSGANAISKAAEASAGYLVGDICALTHGQPAAVCSQVPASVVGITTVAPPK
jgi:hypothetical protein